MGKRMREREGREKEVEIEKERKNKEAKGPFIILPHSPCSLPHKLIILIRGRRVSNEVGRGRTVVCLL